MSKDKISDYSSTANSNTDIAAINIDEGCAPSGINNAIRALMAQLKNFQTGASGDTLTVGGVLTVTGGSASAPAITTSGDTNTGVLFPAADTVGITTGGTERVRVDSSGNVGVGTSSPSAPLTVKTNSSYLTQDIIGDATNGWASIRFRNAANSATSVFFNYDNAAYKFGTVGAEPIVFNTNNTERARIDSSGNLGVGTSSPSYKLDLNKGSNGFNARFGNGTNYFYTYSDGSGNYLSSDTSFNTSIFMSPTASGVMTFLTAATERARIHASGGVSIGNTTDLGAGNLNLATGKFLSWGGGENLIYGDTASGYMYFRTNGSERARIDSSGNLLVGKTTTGNTTTGWNIGVVGTGNQVFNITSSNEAMTYNNNNSTGATYLIDFRQNNSQKGYIAVSSTAVTYSTSSDYRLKNTIAPMTGALSKVAALKPCTYKWNADGSDGEGFIAHELAEVCPHAVTGEKDAVDADGNPKYQGIDTSFLVATLTAAIQEQQAIIESLKARLDAANL